MHGENLKLIIGNYIRNYIFLFQNEREIKFHPEMFVAAMSPRTASPFIAFCEAQNKLTTAKQYLAASKMLPFGEVYCSCNSSGLRISCNKMLSARPQRTFY